MKNVILIYAPHVAEIYRKVEELRHAVERKTAAGKEIVMVSGGNADKKMAPKGKRG